MYPGMMAWWKHARHRRHACGEGASCGHAHEHGHGHGHEHGGAYAGPFHEDGGFDGGAFGVRRPLRFLANRLELEEAQVEELARILNELKTERAQAAVDHRRTTAAFADGIAEATFDSEKVATAASARVKSAERLRDAVVTALGRIHALLEPAQRAKLAYLIRTGALLI